MLQESLIPMKRGTCMVAIPLTNYGNTGLLLGSGGHDLLPLLILAYKCWIGKNMSHKYCGLLYNCNLSVIEDTLFVATSFSISQVLAFNRENINFLYYHNNKRACMCARMHTPTHTHMYTHTYTRRRACAHTHTHTHTHDAASYHKVNTLVKSGLERRPCFHWSNVKPMLQPSSLNPGTKYTQPVAFYMLLPDFTLHQPGGIQL